MAKRNDDFFVEKKSWSKVKDELLRGYLTPYVAKILHTNKPIAYVDCFAGKGKFEDGNPGSPIIALDIFQESLVKTKMDIKPQIEYTFIDLNYASELKENLKEYSGTIKIISGAYEDTIKELLKSKAGWNVFLYIDPYGIKSLDCLLFDTLANGKLNTIELLINMNSFGFIREACNAMGAKFKIDDSNFFDDLVEYDPTFLYAEEKSIETLNRIAGGVYWMEIIAQYKSGVIDGYKAEEYFSERYCQRLGEGYKYVLNMPIRIQRNQHPKYRMIHATNHPAGCVLMANNICSRWQLLKDIQSSGQIALFQEDINNQRVDEYALRERIIGHFSQYDIPTSLTVAEAEFYVKYGPICKSGEIGDILRDLEEEKRLEVDRNPACSEKTKRKSSFMSEGHGKTIKIKWVE